MYQNEFVKFLDDLAAGSAASTVLCESVKEAYTACFETMSPDTAMIEQYERSQGSEDHLDNEADAALKNAIDAVNSNLGKNLFTAYTYDIHDVNIESGQWEYKESGTVKATLTFDTEIDKSLGDNPAENGPEKACELLGQYLNFDVSDSSYDTLEITFSVWYENSASDD